jgi:cell shape-determining protein MreC
MAFLRWQKHAFEAKLEESCAQLEKTQSIVEELLKICQEAEDKNKDLILENEELRQASLDGIEIAKAVQELTKEREKLSKDLNSKNIAIQQLINDNNEMSEKLGHI